MAYSRWLGVVLASCFSLALELAPQHAFAQAEAGASVSAQTSANEAAVVVPEATPQPSAIDHWWFGGYYRYNWIPSFLTSAFLARAPAIANSGFGFVATYRTGGGMNVEMGFGHMPYHFAGPVLAKDSEVTDTELARSNIELWHLTTSLLWDVEFHPVIALEIGFGIDFGVFSGHLIRNEAYYDSTAKQFKDCTGPLNPGLLGPPDSMGQQVPYCNVPENGSYNAATGAYQSDAPDAKGEQYRVRDNHVPPVMLFPMLPRFGLRIQPIKYVMIRGDFAFGIAQMFVGATLQVNFGFAKSTQPAKVAEPLPPPPPPVAAKPMGRVLGKVMDDDTNTPVAGVTIKRSGGAATLTSGPDGRFVVGGLEPGLAHFDVEHQDYQPGQCEVDVPAAGGDLPLVCHLHALAPTGAISGQIKDEKGQPIQTDSIELTGPRGDRLKSDSNGLFAAVDLPVGSYRMHVEVDGYLAQSVEVAIEAHQTAMPEITLVKKPKKVLVELRKEEIVITQQVQFKLASAEILPESGPLLSQVADVLLRHSEIQRVEIQGHTDSKGSHDMNMRLSQARAESVRNWLLQAGVGSDRLQAVGYGPDNPIAPNDTAKNRALNRRVQFIIRQQ